jgi:phospholipid transport system transporter-binding protein
METATLQLQQNKLCVIGALNFVTVVKLWRESLPTLAPLSALQFDLAQVTSSNSAGVSLLLEWVKYAKQSGKTIEFKNIPAQLLSIIKVSGIQNILV